MTAVETVTIINKSGKIVGTGRHLVNIFKDAKAAYQDRKKELKLDRENHAGLYGQTCLEIRTVISHRSNRPQRQRQPRDNDTSQPPLTARNLSFVTDSSSNDTLKCLNRTSDKFSYRTKSNQNYHHFPDTNSENNPRSLPRRYTAGQSDSNLKSKTSIHPPPYSPQISQSRSHPELNLDSKIDMDLAYGRLPYELRRQSLQDSLPENELHTTITKLDKLLLEARCLQCSASAIITHLQDNPEAMAAVALTLAELSTIVTKMGPSVLSTLQTASPAVFALLASPQFLVATGVAMGVTVVMFGGYRIIKKIQTNVEHKREIKRMGSALAYNGVELDSIRSWRRGVTEAEALSLSSDVDRELITPEAVRQKRRQVRNLDEIYHIKAESVSIEQRDEVESPGNPQDQSPNKIAYSETAIKSSRKSEETPLDVLLQKTNKDKRKKNKKKSSLLSSILEIKKR